jgi:hypothetical protein
MFLAAFVLHAAPSYAQGFGIGGRMAWVTADTELDVDSVRFTGGQIRITSSRWGIELSMDRHSEELESLNQKVTETPIQASLLMRLGGQAISPYLLGGPGWYKRSVERLDASGEDDGDIELSTREFGWHAGGGLELRAGRHFGIHGDYRYTFLDFGDDDDDDDDGGLVGRLLPGHRGSMWTVGATIYF